MEGYTYNENVSTFGLMDGDSNIEDIKHKISMAKCKVEHREVYVENIFSENSWQEDENVLKLINSVNDVDPSRSRDFYELIKLAVINNDIDLIQYLHQTFGTKTLIGSIYDYIVEALYTGKWETALYVLISYEHKYITYGRIETILKFCIRYNFYSFFVELINEPNILFVIKKGYSDVEKWDKGIIPYKELDFFYILHFMTN